MLKSPPLALITKSSDGVRLKILIDQPSTTVLFDGSHSDNKLSFDLQQYTNDSLHFKSFYIKRLHLIISFGRTSLYTLSKIQNASMVFIDTLTADAMNMYGYERHSLSSWADLVFTSPLHSSGGAFARQW